MSLETVRINKKGREQLIRLKRITGIENWNVLCRWALCVSLEEDSIPPNAELSREIAVEINWRTFGGKAHGVYLALLKTRCKLDGKEVTDNNLAETLRIHLHRGLGYLYANKKVRSIEDLFEYIPAA